MFINFPIFDLMMNENDKSYVDLLTPSPPPSSLTSVISNPPPPTLYTPFGSRIMFQLICKLFPTTCASSNEDKFLDPLFGFRFRFMNDDDKTNIAYLPFWVLSLFPCRLFDIFDLVTFFLSFCFWLHDDFSIISLRLVFNFFRLNFALVWMI